MTNNFKDLQHLHVHNQHSLLDGLFSSEQWAEKAKELGFKYLALTNHGNADGLIKHQAACDKFGIIPIHGVEFYIVSGDPSVKVKGEKRAHMTVWIKDSTGFQNVLRLLTVANLNYFYHRPRIGFDLFLEHTEGLCVGTACSSSFLNLDGGMEFFEKLHSKIGNDLYVELMPHQYPEQEEINNLCLDLSEKYGVKTIATQDCHYVEKHHWESHSVLLACQTKRKMSDPTRWQFSGQDFFLCSPEYMVEKFREQGILTEEEINTAMANTLEIAEKCKDFRIEKKEILLPMPPQFKDMDEEVVLRQLCEEGFKNKFSEVTQEYRDRFEYELSVLKDFNVIKYFLIVYDLVDWCKKNEILTGPGRGSSGGCLISFLLGVIKIDPVKYGLLFERFLNPGRKGLPDIDIDFENNKRNQVVGYLKNTYGESSVAGITTFLASEDKGTIRDVSRVFEVSLFEADKFSKSVVDTVENALLTKDGQEFNALYPEVVKHILALKGGLKAYGRHASAILVSPEDLTLGTRASLAERNDQLVASLDGNDCEHMGVIKLDILGLNTLSVVSMALQLIKQNKGKDIDLEKINLEDKIIYKNISAGLNTGCFQINTYTLTKLIKDMGVGSLQELSDAVSLCRPGPFDSGATSRYIERKHGKIWDKKHPIWEDITKQTYSEVVYQEQVIKVIHKVAGLSLAESDEVRKIIAKKKDIKLLEKFKKKFISGCLEQKTFNRQEAEVLFEELGHFSKYSFNMSHAMAYSVLSYWTAWLKHYFPSEFLAAALTFGGEAEKPNLLKEAQRLNLQIVPPKIETSHPSNWVVKENNLYIPFSECKGLGPKNIETITQYQKSLTPGFFSVEKPIIKGKLLTILTDIGAFTDDTPDTINPYFSLGISLTPETTYKKLFDLIKDTEYAGYNINDLLTGNFKNGKFAKIKDKAQINGLFQCCGCELRSGCDKPSLPQIGTYNVAIFNEQENWNTERDNKYLFKELLKYGFQSSDFQLSNIVKCGSKKKINKDHISACSDKFLTTELGKVRIVLAFGNAGVQAFHDGEEKISKLNGTCEWNEKYGVWVVYSIPPGWPLWKDDFKPKFKEAIKVFADKLETIGGFV